MFWFLRFITIISAILWLPDLTGGGNRTVIVNLLMKPRTWVGVLTPRPQRLRNYTAFTQFYNVQDIKSKHYQIQQNVDLSWLLIVNIDDQCEYPIIICINLTYHSGVHEMSSPSMFSWVRVTRSFVLCVMLCWTLFVLFNLAILLSVPL